MIVLSRLSKIQVTAVRLNFLMFLFLSRSITEISLEVSLKYMLAKTAKQKIVL